MTDLAINALPDDINTLKIELLAARQQLQAKDKQNHSYTSLSSGSMLNRLP